MKYIFSSLLFILFSFFSFGQTTLAEQNIRIESLSKVQSYQLKANNKSLDGEYIILKKNGSKYNCTFKNGQLDGKFTRYNNKGTVLFTHNYQQGLLHGQQTTFYPNGKIMETFTMKKGMVDGEMKIYDQDGKLIHQRQYNKGEEIIKKAPQSPPPSRAAINRRKGNN